VISTRRATMVANKRYQIFVSSTQADLRNERESIIIELTKVGYIAVGMEQFPATDEEQMDFIQPVIDDSDYYVVVIKGRYGSVGNDGISYTEKEFRYAVETKKPAMAFLYKDVLALRVSETDNDPEKMKKLSVFRAELEQKRIVKYWLTVEELVTQVKDSVNDMLRCRPAIGWIRGDQSFDPGVYRERDELRKEVDVLQKKLEMLDTSVSQTIAHGDDIVDIYFDLVICEYNDSGNNPTQTRVFRNRMISIPCDLILNCIKDKLYNNDSEEEIIERIDEWVQQEYETTTEYYNLGKHKNELSYIDIHQKTLDKLRYHFEALGLIVRVVREYRKEFMPPAPAIGWQLTDKGRKYIATMHAFRRRSVADSAEQQ